MNDERTESRLLAYLEGELSPAEAAEVRRQVSGDKRHARMVGQMREARSMLQSLPRVKAPADVAEGLDPTLERAALLETGPASDRPWVLRGPAMAVAATLVGAGAIGLAVWFILPRGVEGPGLAFEPSPTSEPAAEAAAREPPPPSPLPPEPPPPEPPPPEPTESPATADPAESPEPPPGEWGVMGGVTGAVARALPEALPEMVPEVLPDEPVTPETGTAGEAEALPDYWPVMSPETVVVVARVQDVASAAGVVTRVLASAAGDVEDPDGEVRSRRTHPRPDEPALSQRVVTANRLAGVPGEAQADGPVPTVFAVDAVPVASAGEIARQLGEAGVGIVQGPADVVTGRAPASRKRRGLREELAQLDATIIDDKAHRERERRMREVRQAAERDARRLLPGDTLTLLVTRPAHDEEAAGPDPLPQLAPQTTLPLAVSPEGTVDLRPIGLDVVEVFGRESADLEREVRQALSRDYLVQANVLATVGRRAVFGDGRTPQTLRQLDLDRQPLVPGDLVRIERPDGTAVEQVVAESGEIIVDDGVRMDVVGRTPLELTAEWTQSWPGAMPEPAEADDEAVVLRRTYPVAVANLTARRSAGEDPAAEEVVPLLVVIYPENDPPATRPTTGPTDE